MRSNLFLPEIIINQGSQNSSGASPPFSLQAVISLHGSLKIDYTYTKLRKKKKYEESVEIDFEQYGRCLVYISDIDELRNVNKKIVNEVEKVKRDVHKIYGVVVQYANLNDSCNKTMIAGYEEDKD